LFEKDSPLDRAVLLFSVQGERQFVHLSDVMNQLKLPETPGKSQRSLAVFCPNRKPFETHFPIALPPDSRVDVCGERSTLKLNDESLRDASTGVGRNTQDEPFTVTVCRGELLCIECQQASSRTVGACFLRRLTFAFDVRNKIGGAADGQDNSR
jgi:hypothetical protein